MSSASGPRPVSFKVRHVTHFRTSATTNGALVPFNRGPVATYEVVRPIDGSLERSDTVVCEHCGRQLRVTVLSSAGMRGMRGPLALILGVPVAGAVAFAVMMSLLALVPGVAFPAEIVLVILAGTTLLAVLALLLAPLGEKGISLEDDRPAGLPPGGATLPPEQQFHTLA